jgi:hypothetical protein
MARAHYVMLFGELTFRKNDATQRRSDAAIEASLRRHSEFATAAAASRASRNCKLVSPPSGRRVTTP